MDSARSSLTTTTMTTPRQNDAKLFKEILKGIISENFSKSKSKLISIFLSSTFTDMKNERDYLAKNAFPVLAEYCKSVYNLDFQVIDMRWGIEGFSYKSNLSGHFCLEELQRCFQISAKPCFIVTYSLILFLIFIQILFLIYFCFLF